MLPVDAARIALSETLEAILPGLGRLDRHRLLDGLDALVLAHLTEQARQPTPPAPATTTEIDLREHPEWRTALAKIVAFALMEIRTQTRGGHCRDPELVNLLADLTHCLPNHLAGGDSLHGTMDDPRRFDTRIMRSGVEAIGHGTPHRVWVRDVIRNMLPRTP